MKNLFEFFVEVDKLKRTYRYSTRDSAIQDSVADHSWKLAMMVIFTTKELDLEINILHAIKLALCHDIQEYIAGEIDARRIHREEFSKEKKFELEKNAIEEIKEKFGKIGEEIKELWEEFEEGKTKEAKYVNALDKIEAISHLLSVERVEKFDMDYTAVCANESVKNFPELKPLLKEVQMKLKKECEKIGEVWKAEYELD